MSRARTQGERSSSTPTTPAPAGEPFLAARFAAALGFVLIACPKKDEELARVIFDETPQGVPLVAAHDRERLHLDYLPADAAVALRGAVERRYVAKLHKLLKGLDPEDMDLVVVFEDGLVEIRRHRQSTIRHRLDAIFALDWQPPPDTGAVATTIPLALASDHLARAARYPEALVSVEHRTSARAIVSLTQGTEVVARAVIAERGHVLYPKEEPPPSPPPGDPRQGDLFAPKPPSVATVEALARADERLMESLRAKAGVDAPTPPRAEVFTLSRAAWEKLSDTGRDQLTRPTGAVSGLDLVAWELDAHFARSEPLAVGCERHTALVKLEARVGLERAPATEATVPHELAAEVKVWIDPAAWRGLDEEARAELGEPLDGCVVDWQPRADWMAAVVPDDELLVALRGLCDAHGLTLQTGDLAPPHLDEHLDELVTRLSCPTEGPGAATHIEVDDGVCIDTSLATESGVVIPWSYTGGAVVTFVSRAIADLCIARWPDVAWRAEHAEGEVDRALSVGVTVYAPDVDDPEAAELDQRCEVIGVDGEAVMVRSGAGGLDEELLVARLEYVAPSHRLDGVVPGFWRVRGAAPATKGSRKGRAKKGSGA